MNRVIRLRRFKRLAGARISDLASLATALKTAADLPEMTGQGLDEGLQWFSSVLEALDQSNANLHKLAVLKSCLVEGLAKSQHDDLAWLIYFLAGGKLPRSIRSSVLREAAIEASGLPLWLFEACYAHAGDLAETIAYCTDPSMVSAARPLAPEAGTEAQVEPPTHEAGHFSEDRPESRNLHRWITEEAIPIAGADPAAQRHWLIRQWRKCTPPVRFAINKMMTSGFRLGVSRASVLRALSEASGLAPSILAQRFMAWTREIPSGERLCALINRASLETSATQVLPFCLANTMDDDWAAMGDAKAWQAEWKWDGIRVQWIAGAEQSYLWSRGEELISEQFPDIRIEAFRQAIPVGTVIDGELLAWDALAGQVAGFAVLQTRLNRKKLSASLLRTHPVRLMAYDLLRLGDQDLREHSLAQRREKLEALAASLPEAFLLSPCFSVVQWANLADLRQQARSIRAEGVMLKHLGSPYLGGRTKQYVKGGGRSGWWKWKLDPFTIDAVLIYAQAGHGRRANLYTDYTFAVRGPQGWLSLAKAYSGLSDAEIREVDARIRKTTVEQFGPVRVVEPSMVFEIAFEAIAPSKRHKAGLALRFPRMVRWRRDKRIEDADTLQRLHELLRIGEP